MKPKASMIGLHQVYGISTKATGLYLTVDIIIWMSTIIPKKRHGKNNKTFLISLSSSIGFLPNLISSVSTMMNCDKNAIRKPAHRICR